MTTRFNMIQQGERGVIAAAPDYEQNDKQTSLADALASIHHWADATGLDWHDGLSRAHYHWAAEKNQPLNEETVA